MGGPAYTVLIVEDEEVFRNVLPRIIDWRSLGFEVAGTAENGGVALAFCARTPVDVVLTDIRMPVLDGIELAMELKLSCPGTKVVLLSAFEDFEYARRGISCGVYGYILKSEGEEEIERYFTRMRQSLDEERLSARDRRDVPQSSLGELEARESASLRLEGAEREIPAPGPRATKLVRDAIECMKSGYQGTVSLESVAAKLKVHPAHLSRVFSRDYGKTFTCVLAEIRIEAAKALLADGRYRIYEVADLVGFEKAKYFSELFKKMSGYTPHEYRERCT
jgi:YesN/AraC family two-component response regulator